MTEQTDILGEIHGDEEDEIINIAWEAAGETGKQMIDGTVPVCRRYVVYSDFNEFMKRKMGEMQPAPADISHARERIEGKIKEILEACQWEQGPGQDPRKARFYTPSTD